MSRSLRRSDLEGPKRKHACRERVPGDEVERSDDEKLRAELHHEAFTIAEANEPAARYRFTAPRIKLMNCSAYDSNSVQQ
jgi:hypothetical protein